MAEGQASAATPVVIQTFTAPRLDLESSRYSEKKRKFLLGYKTYVAKCQAAAATGTNVQTVSMLSCVDEDAMELMLAIGEIRDSAGVTVLTKEGVTEELLEHWLRLNAVDTQLISRSELKEKLSNIKWKFGVKFAEAVSLLAGDIYLEIARSGCKALMDDSTAVKWLTTIFREKIGVPKFKEDLWTLMAKDEEMEKDWMRTVNTAKDMAVDFQRWSKNQSSQGKSRSEEKSGKSEGSSKASKKRNASSAKDTKETQPPLCLNQETCEGEHHYVRDCPHTSEEHKKRLLREFREKKARDKKSTEAKKKARINAVLKRKLAKDTTKFFIQSMFVEAEADSGSAVTVCPSRLVVQLRSRGIEVNLRDIPIRSYRIADDTQSVSVTQEVTIPKLTMLSRGNTIDLVNVRMYVSDDVPLVLLGRTLLNEVGFSFADFLQRKGRHIHGKDMGHVCPEEDDAEEEGRVVFTEPHLDADDDYEDVELEDPRSSLPTEADRVKAEEEFEAMIAKAKTGPHGKELEELVRKYKDVFTTDFSASAAKVEPMRVELKSDMEPAHTPVRRYRPQVGEVGEQRAARTCGERRLAERSAFGYQTLGGWKVNVSSYD